MRRHDDVLFPVTETRAEGLLDVGDGHQVHWEETGNPDGIPWIESHGGPGGRANRFLRALIDPERCRIIQFDQRGCGRSTPTGELDHTGLWHTVADMEAIRQHLGIDRWIVGGPSWGSTVSLAYAETHPERTIGVKVSGVWLCRAADIDWWYHGVRQIFPDAWAEYAGAVPADERHDLREAYQRRIFGDDPVEAEAAGRRQYLFEEAYMHFEPPFAPPNPERGLPYSRVFTHHAVNDFFLRENQLIDDAHRLAGIPVSLTTGRYDMCTTPAQAWDLAQALAPDRVRLQIVSGAGHYPSEPAMSRAVALETTTFLDWLDALGRT
ncbi:MAG TPA: alpha/beta fold hydrolase [Acidimicrobiales bacterium]|nr:alpha/beta fold hydrolase [Acidimicrobiales bacterium]